MIVLLLLTGDELMVYLYFSYKESDSKLWIDHYYSGTWLVIHEQAIDLIRSLRESSMVIKIKDIPFDGIPARSYVRIE